jgi:hypothetical protein
MATRQTGKWGQIMLPLNDGALSSNVELTLAASKTIQGTEYANRFFGHANTHWNQAKTMQFRIQGVVGSVDISPVASVNDTVSVGAFNYYGDDGAVMTAAAQRQALTRDGTKNQIHMLTASIASGSIGITAGVASVASFSDTFGADAGPAYVSINKLVLAEIRLTPGSAGVVAAADINVTNLAGELVQDRSDIPTGEIYALQGGVLLSSALRGNKTAGATRKVYATFYSQMNVLAALGHTTKCSMTMSSASVEMPAQGDSAAMADVSGPPKWSGSFERYAVDSQLYELAFNTRYAFLRVYRDRTDTTKYREGAIIITGLSENIDQGAAILETLTFQGNGPLDFIE